MTYLIRPMIMADIAAVVAVQADAYEEYFHESSDVIAARLSVCADTAWVAEKFGDVCAYLVAYESCVGKVTALNTSFNATKNPDCLYLHDLAIARRARGAGLARQLLCAAERYAAKQALAQMALISVQDSKVFWTAFGFNEFALLDIDQEKNLLSYNGDAATVYYMIKNNIPDGAI